MTAHGHRAHRAACLSTIWRMEDEERALTYEYVFPELAAVPAAALQPGDRVWGMQQTNVRNGFLLDTEPYEVRQTEAREGVLLAYTVDEGERGYPDPQTLVLVERRA